jgi:hypothetical protein
MTDLTTADWLAYWFLRTVGDRNFQAAAELARLSTAQKITN